MTWANSTGETVDQADVALGYVYGPAGNQLTGENDTITSTDPTMTPANWSGSFGMQQPAPTAVAVGVAIPGIGVGVGNVADCPYLAAAWADSFAPLVDPSDVAAGYQYGPINRPIFGTNEGVTSDEPPVAPESWMGTFCGLQPAPTAVAVGVAIPGVGVGTAEVVAPDMPTPIETLKESDVRIGVEFGNGKTGTLEPCFCDSKCQTLNFFVGAESPVQIDLRERKGRMVRLLIYSVDVKVFESASVIVGEDGKADFVIDVPDVGNLQFNGLPPYASFGYHVLDRMTGQTIKHGDAQGFQHHT